MRKYIKKIWQRISYIGVTPGMPEDLCEKIILCNRLSVTVFIVVFLGELNFFASPTLFAIGMVSCFTYASPLLWNSLGWFNFSRFVVIIFPPLFILLVSGLMTEGSIVSFKFSLMTTIIAPLILFRVSEKLKMFAGILWVLLACIFFDTITGWIPRIIEIEYDSKMEQPSDITANALVTLVLFAAAFLYIQNLYKAKEKKMQVQLLRRKQQIVTLQNNVSLTSSKLQHTEQLYTELEAINKSLSSQALRAQIDPHFMFNALNSIQNFIMSKDTASAMNYVSKFSKLMRQTMESSLSETITIEDELTLLKNYLDLEKLRFNQAFDYVFEADEQIDTSYTEIPSMLLQPFVENAVLHGLRHRSNNGMLKIILLYQFEHILCIVEDNGIGRIKSAAINANREGHKSRGSSVTNNRLALLNTQGNTKTNVIYIDLYDESENATGTRVEITIPMVF